MGASDGSVHTKPGKGAVRGVDDALAAAVAAAEADSAPPSHQFEYQLEWVQSERLAWPPLHHVALAMRGFLSSRCPRRQHLVCIYVYVVCVSSGLTISGVHTTYV